MDLNAVLRTAGDNLGRNVIPARIGARTLRDPDLPIDILLAEREVVAFRATDDAAAEVLHVHNIFHKFVVGIADQQVRGRKRPVVLFPQLVHEMIDRAWNCNLGKDVDVLAQDRQRLAVEYGIDVGKTAGPAGADLVGRASSTLPEAASVSF